MAGDGGAQQGEAELLLGSGKSVSIVGNVATQRKRKYSLASGVFIAFFMVMGGEFSAIKA